MRDRRAEPHGADPVPFHQHRKLNLFRVSAGHGPELEPAPRDRFDLSLPVVRAHRDEKVADVDVGNIQHEPKWIVPGWIRRWDLRSGKCLLQAVRLEDEPNWGVAAVLGAQVFRPCDYDVEKVSSVRVGHWRAGARFAGFEQRRLVSVRYFDGDGLSAMEA